MAFAKCAVWYHTVALIETMLEERLEPDIVSYNAIMITCENIKHDSFNSSVASGGSWLSGSVSKWDYAFAVLNQMIGERIIPDTKIYNATIRVCAGGRHWESALDLLAACRKSATADSLTYFQTISICEKCAECQHVLALLLNMHQASG
eukprot:gnl/MRDRNA2_/MRDRNA2_47282_c0_seq1.p1 gnl/MRDRNA2_/MRDRNA2_47282_c0~~gnl/MRDRNA2_/MRDRNA2_47282_c0_seq1.p1  ORF type:complete len:149 (-),score=16.99 gnl/MRDRNA2_/MRDRNA2_47282_c0_seq1:30-476(-)